MNYAFAGISSGLYTKLMYYFYYFINNGVYYGGITNNIARRTNEHNQDLEHGFKSDSKPWPQIQDKIALTVLWSFNTKKEAATYEKQWIIANYKNDNCLNHLASNSDYDATTKKHRELCEQNGGCKAKPFFIKEYPSGKILLEADSTCDEKAQEFLKMGREQISGQLTNKEYSLFIRLESGQIVYLEYTNQSLSERAKLLGRSIESDYKKVLNRQEFKTTLSLQHKDGRKAFLKNYATYYEAGRMLGLKTCCQLSSLCAMIAGRKPSCYGWSVAP